MGHDLDDVALFVDAVRAGGVRAAAAQRGVPRSTVSRRLLRLEKALGVALFQRGSTKLKLTDAGAAHFEQLSRAVDEVRTVCGELSAGAREPRGTLRLATTPAFAECILPELTTRYLALHPRVRVELLTSAERIDLVGERVDLAIRAGAPPDTRALTARRLSPVVIGYYASPEYLRRRGVPESVDALLGHELLVAGAKAGGAEWSFVGDAGVRRVKVEGRVHVDNTAFLRKVAEHGGGIARLPDYQVADALAAGTLVPVLRPHWLRTEVMALFPLRPPAKTRAFLKLLGQLDRLLPGAWRA